MQKFLAPIFIFLLSSATHIGPKYDTKPREYLDQVGIALAKEHHLKFLNSGLGSLVGSPHGVWALNFTSKDKLTLEEAKPLVTALSYRLLYTLHHNALFTKYCKHVNKPLQDEMAGFKVAFWDENVDRPLYPHLAQIRLCDNKIYYHYADPKSQALLEPIVENLEDLQLSYR